MGMAHEPPAAGGELYRRLQLSLLLRVILVTFLLGATVVIQFSQTAQLITTPLLAIYFLSGVTYFITLVSVIALRVMRRLNILAYLQIVWEVLFVTALVYVTGGIHSIFAFLYLLAIIIGGTLQYRIGSFLAAAAGTLCYAAVLGGMEAGWVPSLLGHFDRAGWFEVTYVIFINLAAMFGIAFLSSYLTEILRATGDELQETQRHRDELEALNDNIVLSLSSGLITLDMDARVMTFNQAAEGITGFSQDDAIGINAANIFPQLAEGLTLDPGKIDKADSRREITWQSPKAGTRHLEFRFSPLRGAREKLLGTLVILNDITEIREMEQRLRKSDRLAAVGQLAAGIAHEIRNPLASISGSIQVLAQDLELDSTSKRLMQIVTRETERLNALITDFLLYARPASRVIESVRLDMLISELIEVYNNRADIPEGTEWKVDVGPSLTVETDPKLLEQIMWNLINNSVQSIPEGGKIWIRAYNLDQEGESTAAGETEEAVAGPLIAIEVEDSGVGIPPELRDKIFDPFFTTRDGGTGLGLSTVYRIVEAMEGTVNVEAGTDGGTKFIIKVPARVIKQESGEANRSVAADTVPGGRR